MRVSRPAICFILLLLLCQCAMADSLIPLRMDGPDAAPAPKDSCYLSPTEYLDDSIHVSITDGYWEGVHYTCARIRIAHPSQLRTIPAHQVQQPNAQFSAMSSATALGGQIARASNAVIAVNGDFYTNEKCQVVMRQGIQIRNTASGNFDVLIIDKEGNFDSIERCTRKDYLAYYDLHAPDMYQALCFGPVLVKDGKNVVAKEFKDFHMISNKKTQRVAICQIDELDYMVITCDGDATGYTFGMTVPVFSRLCEQIGYQVHPDGFRMAYNLDGGNSSSIFFKQPDAKGNLVYQKLNMPERERDLADMICFVTLVR